MQRGDPSNRRDELFLDIGGVNRPAWEHLRWRPRVLRVGDEVRIGVMEMESVRTPATLRAQQSYVRKMARKFGWKLQTRPA